MKREKQTNQRGWFTSKPVYQRYHKIFLGKVGRDALYVNLKEIEHVYVLRFYFRLSFAVLCGPMLFPDRGFILRFENVLT